MATKLPRKTAGKIYSIGNNSTVDCRVLMKFGTWLQYGSVEAAEWLKCTYGQIQDGGYAQIGTLTSTAVSSYLMQRPHQN